MLIGTVALVLALELAVVGWPGSSLRRIGNPNFYSLFEIGMLLVFAAGAMNTILLLCSFGLYLPVVHLGNWLISGGPHWTLHSVILASAAYFVAWDFIEYWFHRAFHTKWLWWVHKFHHADAPLGPLTAFRIHPLSGFFNPLMVSIPAALFGAPPAAISVLLSTWIARSLLQHSALPWGLGWAGRWLLVGPLAHRIHHSTNPALFNRNFGAAFIFWDRMFGTYARPSG